VFNVYPKLKETVDRI